MFQSRGDMHDDEDCWCPSLNTMPFEAVKIMWMRALDTFCSLEALVWISMISRTTTCKRAALFLNSTTCARGLSF